MPRRASARVQQRRKQNLITSVWWTSGAAVVAAVLLIVLSPRALPGVTVPPLTERPYAGEGKTLGPADAPVLVEEFSDFQCPFCQRFALQALPRLEADYIAIGMVQFVYHHFAFIGQESIQAAQAVECATEQGRAWDYMDTLWANQRGENRGAFSDLYLKSFADAMGLDTLDFNACLDSGRYRSAVEEDKRLGQSRGVSSTPSVFVNGKYIDFSTVPDPYEAIRAEINAVLAGR